MRVRWMELVDRCIVHLDTPIAILINGFLSSCTQVMGRQCSLPLKHHKSVNPREAH